jgi:hypothetical protein
VRGVPPADPWTALPLRRSIAESPVTPEAVAGCWRGDCPEQLAVGVFRATGEEAANLARTLDDPERLARVVRRAPPSP